MLAPSSSISTPNDAPLVLDNLKLWFGLAIALVIIAYSLPLAAIISRGGLLGPGGRPAPMVVETILLLLSAVGL